MFRDSLRFSIAGSECDKCIYSMSKGPNNIECDKYKEKPLNILIKNESCKYKEVE